MSNSKAYWQSFLSALMVIGWFIFVFRMATFDNDNSALERFILTIQITVVLGIICGIAMLLAGITKVRRLKFSFAYNLLGTLNIMVGIFGMINRPVLAQTTPYI